MKKSILLILLVMAVPFIIFFLIPQLGLVPSDAAFRRQELERHILPLQAGDLRAIQVRYLQAGNKPAAVEVIDPVEVKALLEDVKGIRVIPLAFQLFAGWRPKDASSVTIYFIRKEGKAVRFAFQRSPGEGWLSSSMRSRELSDRISRIAGEY